MTDWARWFASSGGGDEKRIFEGMGEARANFRVVATNVRHGAKARDYVLEDGGKWKAVVEKWRFRGKQEPLSRCGYDYRIEATNGEARVTVMVCFLCNTLIVNGAEMYGASRRQIVGLLEADFRAAGGAR